MRKCHRRWCFKHLGTDVVVGDVDNRDRYEGNKGMTQVEDADDTSEGRCDWVWKDKEGGFV